MAAVADDKGGDASPDGSGAVTVVVTWWWPNAPAEDGGGEPRPRLRTLRGLQGGDVRRTRCSSWAGPRATCSTTTSRGDLR